MMRALLSELIRTFPMGLVVWLYFGVVLVLTVGYDDGWVREEIHTQWSGLLGYALSLFAGLVGAYYLQRGWIYLLIAWVMGWSVWIAQGVSEEVMWGVYGLNLLFFILVGMMVPFVHRGEYETKQQLIHIHHILRMVIDPFILAIALVVAVWSLEYTLKVLFGIESASDMAISVIPFLGVSLLFFHRLRHREGYRSFLAPFLIRVLNVFVLIIFVIVDLYLMQILFSRVWPQGEVASIMIGASMLGVLSYWTWYDDPFASRRFFWPVWGSLFLQALMVILAIAQRIEAYGWSEGRVWVMAYGVWLIWVSVSAMIRRSQLAPAHLLAPAIIMIMVILYTPWNLYDWSRTSQQHRLQALLAHPYKDATTVEHIHATLSYLIDHYGVDSVRSLYPTLPQTQDVEEIAHALGVRSTHGSSYMLFPSSDPFIAWGEGRYLLENVSLSMEQSYSTSIEGHSLAMKIVPSHQLILIIDGIASTYDLSQIPQRFPMEATPSISEVMIPLKSASYEARLYPDQIMNDEQGNPTLNFKTILLKIAPSNTAPTE